MSKVKAAGVVTQPIDNELAPDEATPESSLDPRFGQWSSWQRHHIWWLALLFLGGGAAVFTSNSLNDVLPSVMPEGLPLPSTFNKQRSGYSALYDLCEKVGLKVERWQSSYRYLKDNRVAGTLVMIDPWDTPTEDEVQRISNWVEAGNDMVYLDFFNKGPGRRLLEKLGGTANGPRPKVTEEIIPTGSSSAGSSSAWKFTDSVNVRSDTSLEGNADLVVGHNGAIIVAVDHEKGHVLIGSDPSFCSNEHIADPHFKGNFQFFINHLMACKQPIYFDEKCHGYTTGKSALFLMLRDYVGFVLWQLIVVVAIAFIGSNQRFGRALSGSVPRKISNLEFIDGLASTYQRARARDAAWSMLFAPLKARLCKALGVSPHDGLDVLALAWAQATGKSALEYQQFLQHGQDATMQHRLTEKELLELIAKCDSLTADSQELVNAKRILGA